MGRSGILKFKLIMEEKVYFETSDALRLCGILSVAKNKTQKCIILCHGITVDKEEDGIFTNLAYKLCDAGFNVFRFDFRGHGESEGENMDMTVRGEEADIEAAVQFLQKKNFKEFGIVAASFGGGAVSLFVSRYPKLVKALVLWNAVIDYSENINPTLPWTKKYWGKPAFKRAEKFGLTTVGGRGFKAGKGLMREIQSIKPWMKLQAVVVPMLFIHGNEDTAVPYKDSVKYSKLLNANLVTIHGADHGFHDDPEHAKKADKATVEFFQKYL